VRRVRPPVDPHKDSVILLEAFLVEVRLSALYSLGVPTISQGDDFVSAEHIIKLMKTTDAAVVTAGAKVTVGQNSKAETESITRKAIYTDPPNNAKTEYIDVGTSFTAIAEIRKEKAFVELGFQYSNIVKADKNASAIPQIVERNWNSSVCLKFGEPTLIGGTQDKETANFLIVTANIQE
jgi:type II secretory pathway component GspD/PulD (secretin)